MSANFNIVDLLKRKQPRQPWDERAPDGNIPFDPLRGSSTTTNPALQRVATAVPDRDVLSLLKAPTGVPEPPSEGRRVSEQMPQVRVGTDTSQMKPVERQQAKIDLLRNSSPTAKVRETDGFIEEDPPEQSPSRIKNALLGLLLGTAQGGLAGGIGGAALGGIKPEAIQQLLRDRETAKQEEQLESQLGIDAKQAQIEHQRASTDTLRQGRRQIIERPDGVYEITPLHPEGRKLGNIPAEARTSRAPVHYESRDDGLYAVFDSGNGIKGVKVEGVPGKPTSDTQAAQAAEGEAIAESTQAAIDETKAELDKQKAQLTENERSLTQKEALWKTEAAKRVAAAKTNLETLTMADALAQVKAEDADFQSGTYDQTVENTKRLREAVSDGDKRLQGMGREVREGRAKGARRRGMSATVTLDGAIAAFKQQAKRDPTPEEVANIKRHYGLQ